MPSLLAPKNLVKKQIDGRDVTCQELLEYFRAYVNVFGGNELPEPKTMLEATAEANNLAAVAVARDFYTREMEKLCGGDQPYVSPRELQTHHVRFKDLVSSCELRNALIAVIILIRIHKKRSLW